MLTTSPRDSWVRTGQLWDALEWHWVTCPPQNIHAMRYVHCIKTTQAPQHTPLIHLSLRDPQRAARKSWDLSILKELSALIVSGWGPKYGWTEMWLNYLWGWGSCQPSGKWPQPLWGKLAEIILKVHLKVKPSKSNTQNGDTCFNTLSTGFGFFFCRN